MADRAFKITRLHIGAGAAALVAAFVLLPLVAVALFAEGGKGLSVSDWAAIRFTLLQALLSAGISVLLAIPVARALARRQFFGRGALITLLGAPFILPVIVAVFGLLAVFGRNGIFNVALEWLGLPPVPIFGLHGVIIAHVFLNLPLATRMLLEGWNAIPSERFRLAASLGFSPTDMIRTLELPMLARVLPGALMVIFAICLSSFSVALILGGGPRATTVELAIYQAFRFDFDLNRAALLATIQLIVAGTAALLALRFSAMGGFGAGLGRAHKRWNGGSWALRAQDCAVILLAALFLILPISMIVLDGLRGLTSLPANVWRAALTSVIVALASTAITITLALAIAMARARLLEAVGILGIAVSPLVIGTGLFILINPLADPARFALAVTVAANALMALPFALRVVAPSLRDIEADFGRLADSLALTGWARLRWLILPCTRKPLGFAAGLAAALSMGDLGVVTLFADPTRATLPLQMYRLMGAYQMEAAAAAGLLLLALSLGLFWMFDRGGRINADA